MAQGHLATPDKVVGSFPVPTLGVNKMLPINELPPNALVDSLNVMVRQGVLRTRPGMVQFTGDTFNGTPTGVYPYLEIDGSYTPVLGTTRRMYRYDQDTSAWVDNASGDLTANNLQAARFANIVLGTPPISWVLHANGKDPMQRWDGDPESTFISVSGGPPVFSDICNISDHIIGVVPPYGVQWCNIRNIDAWPDLNQQQIAYTPDRVVALRPIGQGNFAVLYKAKSIWGVNYTGGPTEAQSFAFNFIGFFDGPASPAAVVGFDGGHLYMTRTGRVGLFTGNAHQWIADGAWPALRDDIDVRASVRIHGVYDPVFHEVTFYYPQSSNHSKMTGCLVVTLPMLAAGVQDTGAYPGQTAREVTTGGTIRLADEQDRVIVAGDKTYVLTGDAQDDGGTAFPGHWQTGLVGSNQGTYRLESVEVFADRGTGYGAVTIQPVTSRTLNGTGTVGDTVIGGAGDFEKVDEPVRALTGFNIRGRFFGLRGSFTDSSAVKLRIKGATLFALKPAP